MARVDLGAISFRGWNPAGFPEKGWVQKTNPAYLDS